MQPRNPTGGPCRLLSMLLLAAGISLTAAADVRSWSLRPEPPPEAAPVETPVGPDAEAGDLAAAIKGLARELAAHFQGVEPPQEQLAEGLIFCSFVDLKKLSRTSSFGRLLAEQLMSEFQQQGFRVLELRQAQSIMVQEQRGEYGLSRDPEELREEMASGAMLAGTYTVTDDHILVSARILDHRSATLLSSATASLRRNNLTDRLLADRVSAEGGGKKEVLYLKKLEL